MDNILNAGYFWKMWADVPMFTVKNYFGDLIIPFIHSFITFNFVLKFWNCFKIVLPIFCLFYIKTAYQVQSRIILRLLKSLSALHWEFQSQFEKPIDFKVATWPEVMNNVFFRLDKSLRFKIFLNWTSLTRISVKLRWILTVVGFWDVSCEQWV